MMMDGDLDQLDTEALVTRFFAARPALAAARESDYDEYCTQVALRLAALPPAGTAWLKRIALEGLEAFRLRAALTGLATVQDADPQVLTIFHAYLSSSYTLFVMQAIDCLRQVGYDGFRSEVLLHACHAKAHVRSAVVRYLAHFDGRASLPRLLAALYDHHPLVVVSAISALDAVGAAPGAAAPLRALQQHANAQVRHAASHALERNAMQAPALRQA